MPFHLTFEERVAQLTNLLTVMPSSGATKQALEEIIALSADIPAQFFPMNFAELLIRRFNLNPCDVPYPFTAGTLALTSVCDGDEFDALVPANGWLHDYIEWTRCTEPPTVFHFFAAVTVLGATLARRVRCPRGTGDVFPNISCVLVAPAGRAKKTTACNLAVNLFRRIGGNVLADKITPEAIIESFKASTSATGLIYAPEWSVFLGKQQYLEGLVPMLTALFDSPDIWTNNTIMRGTVQLQNVALSHLAASTVDWMQTSITKDAFSGGFMSRLLFIVQHDTTRCFPLPPPLDEVMRKRLIDGLLALQRVTGKVLFSPEGERWYINWYTSRKTSAIDRHVEGYFDRKPDRLLQLAMILNASENATSLVLRSETLQHAEAILQWIEKRLPSVFSELSATVIGDDQQRLLRQLRFHKGELTHAEWLRMNRTRLSAESFRKGVETLKQAGMVAVDEVKKKYYLLPAGWSEDA